MSVEIHLQTKLLATKSSMLLFADTLAIANAKTVNKKLQGTSSKNNSEETTPENAPTTNVNSISTSQQSG